MVKKVRKYILFFIVGLVQALFVKEGKSDAYIVRCSNGQSAQKCCESTIAAQYGGKAVWTKNSKNYNYCNVSQIIYM